MKSHILSILAICLIASVSWSQDYMTPEKLIELNRVSPLGISKDQSKIVYAVSKVDVQSNTKATEYFTMNLDGSGVKQIKNLDKVLADKNISPDGKKMISAEDVKIQDVFGTDLYPEMTQSNMMVYNSLNYRHWDVWEDGKYSHIMVSEIGVVANETRRLRIG